MRMWAQPTEMHASNPVSCTGACPDGVVVALRNKRPGERIIEAARFDAPRNRTILQRQGDQQPRGDRAWPPAQRRRHPYHGTAVGAPVAIAFVRLCRSQRRPLPLRNYPDLAALGEPSCRAWTPGFGGSALCLAARDLHFSIAGRVLGSQALIVKLRATTVNVSDPRDTSA